MKKLFGMTAAALCSLGFFASSADAATVVTASALNVRQQPTTSAAVVGKSNERTIFKCNTTLERLASNSI
ncbi:hypothetical protein GCM10020331_025740 [Ectobacillus funiculus]